MSRADVTEKVGRSAARINAAMAEFVSLVAELDASEAWGEVGMRTSAHWLTVNAGVDLSTATELVRVSHALRHLPRIAAAFADGRLSFDKVRAVTRVAGAADEEMWLHVALHASGAQLARICRAVRRSLEANDPQRADDALSARALRVWWRDDGMLELMAVLPKEDGGVVMAAIEAAAHSIAEERRALALDPTAPDFAPCLRPALRADALVRICEESVAGASRDPVLAPTRQLVVHVDVGVLTGEEPEGRCHIEDGPSLSAQTARWLGCDADVVAIVERQGAPIDVGRLRRLISPRQRLALQARDQGCRYPGCAVPAPRTEGHHIRHWPSGRTELRNLASLCRFHHRRHHEGKFEIRVLGNGALRFEASDGTPLVPAVPRPADTELPRPPGIDAHTARALEGGAPIDFGYAVSVLSDAAMWRRKVVESRGP